MDLAAAVPVTIRLNIQNTAANQINLAIKQNFILQKYAYTILNMALTAK
jgi:hypothetical protein